MTSSPVVRLKLKATGFTSAGHHSQRDNALAVDTLPWGAVHDLATLPWPDCWN
jgi:hypothetical protein